MNEGLLHAGLQTYYYHYIGCLDGDLFNSHTWGAIFFSFPTQSVGRAGRPLRRITRMINLED